MKQRRHSVARMHQRIRELAPVLPILVTAAEQHKEQASALLAAARAAAPGEVFSDGELTLRRCLPTRSGGRPGIIFATSPDGSGPRINISLREDYGFWTWAIIEVLRHTGLRIEEMLELTHRSFIAYTLPTTAEVVPMLQITPCKTDRERLLLVSPELAVALTGIITRVRGENEQLPLVTRYDGAERVNSPALPFLFQRTSGRRQIAITYRLAMELLDRLVRPPPFRPRRRPPRFTPHDFRRVFATDAAAAGLPVHILAKILGHDTIATTQTYVAVYDHDVIEHHRAFIARRRALRPSEEYREPTDAEWDEFLGHFAKRKVELGMCGRALRNPLPTRARLCPMRMLRPDPDATAPTRRDHRQPARAARRGHERGWLGEVEGLEASLAAGQQKLAAMTRRPARGDGPVSIGMPALPRATRMGEQLATDVAALSVPDVTLATTDE